MSTSEHKRRLGMSEQILIYWWCRTQKRAVIARFEEFEQGTCVVCAGPVGGCCELDRFTTNQTIADDAALQKLWSEYVASERAETAPSLA